MSVKLLFLAMSILMGIMPAVPEPTDARAIVFAGVAALLVFVWIARSLLTPGALRMHPAGKWLAAFLLQVVLSALVAALFETPFALWLRGAIPFVFLVLFYPTFDLARRDPEWVVHATLLGSLAWLMTVAVEAVGVLPLVLRGEVQRITHATEAWAQFQLLYGPVALAILLFHPPRWARRARWPLALAFCLPPLFAVSRGQLAIVIGLWLVFLIESQKQRRTKETVIGAVLLVVAGMMISGSEVAVSIVERFDEARALTSSSRLEEVRYALGQFLESPLVGKGLGHQIPADVTFLGDWQAISQAAVSSVGYMHNVVGYLLMDLGALGLVTYVGFLFVAAKGRGRLTDEQQKRRRLWVAVLSALVGWFFVQAAFRQIHSNVLLATATAALAAVGNARFVSENARAR